MPHDISPERVRALARLARLTLSDEDVADMQRDLSRILELVDQLGTLELDDVPATTHAIPLTLRLRPDEARAPFAPEVATAGAPERDGPYITVPRILDTDDA